MTWNKRVDGVPPLVAGIAQVRMAETSKCDIYQYVVEPNITTLNKRHADSVIGLRNLASFDCEHGFSSLAEERWRCSSNWKLMAVCQARNGWAPRWYGFENLGGVDVPA